MNEANTPETDAKLARGFTDEEMNEMHVPASFAMKLEKERDEARREAEAAWDCKWPKPAWSWRTKDKA